MTRAREVEFPAKVRDQAAQRANGRCEKCAGVYKRPNFDHILPAALGGKPTLANCQVLCVPCHAEKTAKEDVPRIRKSDRQRRASNGSKLTPKVKIRSRGFDKPESNPGKIDKSALGALGPSNIARRFK